jgi:hypothetical protein
MVMIYVGNDQVFPATTFTTNYNPNVDATLLNEFSVAAFRFGHTLLNGKFDKYDPNNGNFLGSYQLRFNFNNDTEYKSNPDFGYKSIVRGMTLQAGSYTAIIYGTKRPDLT